MGFRFYVTNLFDGKLQGTDDGKKAQELAECEEFFVVDTETAEWVLPSGIRNPIQPI